MNRRIIIHYNRFRKKYSFCIKWYRARAMLNIMDSIWIKRNSSDRKVNEELFEQKKKKKKKEKGE